MAAICTGAHAGRFPRRLVQYATSSKIHRRRTGTAAPRPPRLRLPASGDDAAALADILSRMAGGGAVDAEQVRAIVADEMAKAGTVQHKVITLEYMPRLASRKSTWHTRRWPRC